MKSLTKKITFNNGRAHIRAMQNTALLAAKLLIKQYGKIDKNKIGEKGANDFVTYVDKSSQQIILDSLMKYDGSYGYLAEEGNQTKKASRMWVIDPLDGTSNYIYNIPSFCISIGLMQGSTPIAGVVYDPIHEEMFSSYIQGGAKLNKKNISVSKTSKLSKALLATGFPFRCKSRFKPYHKSFEKMFYECRGIRRMGSAAIDMCYTACGRFDGFWEMGLQPWDSTAATCIIREAGGKVGDFCGDDNHLISGDTLAAPPKIHRAMVEILSKIPNLPAKVFQNQVK